MYALCGASLSDPGSWRGLVNPRAGAYERELLDWAGVESGQLPAMAQWSALNEAGGRIAGLPAGTPVAVGMNDFYAALHGMDVTAPGAVFDITGTSEHFGVVTDELIRGGLISSPYRGRFVHYGVTAGSGPSLSWGRRMFGENDPPFCRAAPIFLPYLRGERAPVFDPDARGMFVGLSEDTDRDAMSYAILEGVAFSLKDIHEKLNAPAVHEITATGGATASDTLNRMKASLFNAPLIARRGTCGSAVGAATLAGAVIREEPVIYMPDEALHERMCARYAVYRRMYAAWREMTQDADSREMFGG